jgi:rhodanese-related sulfurtransferase
VATLIDRDQLQDLVQRGAQLIEVLPAREYEEDHLPGARSLPLRGINREAAKTLDRARPLIVYCWDAA